MLTRLTSAMALVLAALGAAPAALAGGGGGGCGGNSCQVGVYVPGLPGGGGNGGGGGNVTPVSTGPVTPLTPQQQCAAVGGGWVPAGTFAGVCAVPNATPGTPAPPPITAAQVAQMARAMITLDKPAIGSAPCTDTGCMGAVGVPVWLWVDGGLPTRTATASAGGLSVTVTATMASVDWNMGDGNVVHCNTAGTPYDRSIGWADSPDCGYRYSQPGYYPLTATGRWRIAFTGDYNATTTVNTTSTVQVHIGEYQTTITSVS